MSVFVVRAFLKMRETLSGSHELAQDMLAARCGVTGCDISRGTLAKIEAQIRGVSDKELFVISRILSVRMESLFPKDFAKQLKRGSKEGTEE